VTDRRWVAAVPATLVLLLALAGPWFVIGSTSAPVGGPFQPPDAGIPLGTDVLGRDVLARVLAGGRTVVLQAAAATLIGSVIGVCVGGWAGMAHRTRVTGAVLWVVDGIAAVPALLLLLLLASGIPGNDAVVAVAIAAVSVPFSVRVVRERTRTLATTDYSREAEARGEHWTARARFDILPGIRFVAATQLAATAGFLGLGAGAPAANWGRLVRENSAGLQANPLPVLVPTGLLIILAVGVTVLLDRVAETRVGGLERIGQLA
jgi:peptide/nickel transport system permease protein